MARVHCLLVLLMATWTFAIDLPDVVDDAADVAVATSSGVGDDGRGFTFTQVTERTCGQRYSLLKFDDGHLVEIMDNLEDNVGVVRLSSSPTKCFIREITGTKQRCKNGEFPSSKERPNELSTNYAQGEDVNVGDLPERIRELCEEKTVVHLVAVANGPAVRDADLQRNSRQIMRCTTTKNNCRECNCHGWLFRRRTCQICCDEQEVCTTASG